MSKPGLLLAAAICGSVNCGSSSTSPSQVSAWHIELVTTGGFSGGGTGGLTLGSDGAAELLAPGLSDHPRAVQCRVSLPATDTAGLTETVRRAEPAAWRDRYVLSSNPYGCCDMLGWQLTLQRVVAGKTDHAATFWFDDGLAQSPRDLKALEAQVRAVWDIVRQRCTQGR